MGDKPLEYLPNFKNPPPGWQSLLGRACVLNHRNEAYKKWAARWPEIWPGNFYSKKALKEKGAQ